MIIRLAGFVGMSKDWLNWT